MPTSPLPLWIQILQALLTPAVAFLAVAVAWAQWRAVRQREVMELFERRMALYEAFRQVVARITTHGRVTDKDLYEFSVGREKARFLFGDEVYNYINGLQKNFLKHQEAEASMAMGPQNPLYQQGIVSKSDAFKEICGFYIEFPKLIAPYVRMHAKSPSWL